MLDENVTTRHSDTTKCLKLNWLLNVQRKSIRYYEATYGLIKMLCFNKNIVEFEIIQIQYGSEHLLMPAWLVTL